MISIVIPTLNRSERLKISLVQLAKTTTKQVSEVIVIVDDGDIESIKACIDIVMDPNYSHLNLRCVKESGSPTAVPKWNTGAKYSRYKNLLEAWLMLAADDIEFPAGWLEAALNTPNAGFLGLSDGREPKDYEPHYMATVAWLKTYQNGVLCVPHYKQWGVDVEIAARAHKSNTYVVANTIIPAKHVIWGTAPDDNTYKKGALHHNDDLKMLAKRKVNNFPNDFEGYL